MLVAMKARVVPARASVASTSDACEAPRTQVRVAPGSRTHHLRLETSKALRELQRNLTAGRSTTRTNLRFH